MPAVIANWLIDSPRAKRLVSRAFRRSGVVFPRKIPAIPLNPTTPINHDGYQKEGRQTGRQEERAEGREQIL
jgi:hypothetical protein